MVKDTFKFKSGYKVKLSLTKKPTQITYHFINSEKIEYFVKTAELPHSISNRNPIYKEIKTCLDPTATEKIPAEKVRKILIELQKITSALQGKREVELGYQDNQKEFEKRKKLKEAETFFKKLDNPILYIGSICDWLSAGERVNVIICFVAGCSQIILRNPVSVIGYGESSSGKTYVEQIALSLLPKEFIVEEKQVSPSALFNRSKLDTAFYKDKIVSYGDMGGQNDRENLQDTLELMKELQTEGKLTKPVSVKDGDGNWTIEELKLEGNPSLWYTTIPSYIDSQETSRAIIFSPRTDNRAIFHKRSKAISLKRGKTYSKYIEVKSLSELVPYFVLHLRDIMEEYIVINPYYDIISQMLQKSKYYKRDSEKYFNMLNTITAINFYSNNKYVFEDGQKAIITSKNDVVLFLSMLEGYMGSISVNIKPKAVEVYKEIRANIDDWKAYKGADIDGLNEKGFEVGITTSDYFEKTELEFSSVRSVQQYFKDLYNAGLLRKVGSENRAVLYDINELRTIEVMQDIDIESIVENIELELGFEIAELIENDSIDKTLKITNQHELVEKALW